jgi:hypothetical protein
MAYKTFLEYKKTLESEEIENTKDEVDEAKALLN